MRPVAAALACLALSGLLPLCVRALARQPGSAQGEQQVRVVCAAADPGLPAPAFACHAIIGKPAAPRSSAAGGRARFRALPGRSERRVCRWAQQRAWQAGCTSSGPWLVPAAVSFVPGRPRFPAQPAARHTLGGALGTLACRCARYCTCTLLRVARADTPGTQHRRQPMHACSALPAGTWTRLVHGSQQPAAAGAATSAPPHQHPHQRGSGGRPGGASWPALLTRGWMGRLQLRISAGPFLDKGEDHAGIEVRATARLQHCAHLCRPRRLPHTSCACTCVHDAVLLAVPVP